MRSLFRLPLACALVLSACSTGKQAEKRLNEMAANFQQSPPVPADSAGKYQKTPELDVLDALLHKYPGRQITKTVVEVRTVQVPGKTLYVPVPIKPDTAANRAERDSLLREMVRLTRREKQDDPRSAELRAEVEKLKSRLLLALNRRGCLPDTTVYFPKDSASFTIKRVDATHYLFTCVVSPRTLRVPVRIDSTENRRIAQDMREYWQFWQFWAAAAGWLVAGGFTVSALRGRNG